LVYSSADTSDPVDRDVCTFPHIHRSSAFTTVGDIFSDATNKDRRKKRLDNNRVALLRVAGAPRWVCTRRMPSRHAARVRSMAGTPLVSPASSSWGHITNLCLRDEALIGRFALATTWKRYVRAAAGKRVPRGLSGEAWAPRVGHSIIGILVVAEKHCCAMQ